MRPLLALALAALALAACARPSSKPSAPPTAPDDVAWRRTIPIFDVHGHIDPGAIDKTLAAMDANFIARMVDLTAGEDAAEFAATKKQFDEKGKGRFVLYVNDVYAKHPVEDPEFGRKIATTIEEAVRLGAKGLKISKTLGLFWRDAQGKVIAIDDARLEPMWKTCARLGIPVSIHSGDPKAFWLPVDPNNERYEELRDHPKWAFGGGEYHLSASILEMTPRTSITSPLCCASTRTTTSTSPHACPRSDVKIQPNCTRSSSSFRTVSSSAPTSWSLATATSSAPGRWSTPKRK
jgi:hypothetical protein